MKLVDSIEDTPEMNFIAFVEGNSDPVVSEFDDEGVRTVKFARYKVIGSLSVPPIDEVQLEVWEEKNDADEQDRRLFLVTALDADQETPTTPTNVYDGYVFHHMNLMFGEVIINQIRSAGIGLMASTGEGFDAMEPEVVPLFAKRTMEAFLEMKRNGSLIKI